MPVKIVLGSVPSGIGAKDKVFVYELKPGDHIVTVAVNHIPFAHEDKSVLAGAETEIASPGGSFFHGRRLHGRIIQKQLHQHDAGV